VAEVTYRPYRPGDEIQINDGFNRVFGLNRSLEEWRWKFPELPEGRWIMLAFDAQGSLLAHYGAVPVRLQVAGLTVRAGQPVDSFSLPEGRRGLGAAHTFQRTVEAFFSEFGGPDKLALLFGFPGEKHLRLGMRRLGYEQLTPQPMIVWRRGVGRRGPRFTGHTVRFDPDGGAVDALWARARARYRVAVERDAAWFGRRFLGRPGVDYLRIAAYQKGRPAALAIARVVGATVYLADLVWDGCSDRALTALDVAIDNLARLRGAVSIEMWLCGDRAAEERFTELGWKCSTHPAGLALVARSFHPGIDVTSFPGAFYLTMGDADLV
jgi:hypothetical protein